MEKAHVNSPPQSLEMKKGGQNEAELKEGILGCGKTELNSIITVLYRA